MKSVAAVIAVVVLLAVVGWYATTLVSGVGGFHMPFGVWVAMIAAIIAALGVGGALMTLAFYSSRQGYDEPPEVEREPEPPRD